MNTAFAGGRRRAGLRSWYLVVGALVAGLAVFAVYEIRRARGIVLASMERGAVSLVEAVARGGENALRANAEIEALAAERLLSSARLLRELDARVSLSDTMLARIADENGLFRINVFDNTGRRVASNMGRGHGRGVRAHSEIDAILRGETEELAIGFREARYEVGDRFAAAVRRLGGGAIVVNIDAAEMLAFRRSVGIGRWLREIGENPGVVYAVLQDQEGVLAASAGVSRMPRIAGDRFLEDALASGAACFRETVYADRKVLEAVVTFAVDESGDGLLRMGLSADALQSVDTSVKRRLSYLSLLVAGLLVTGVFLVVLRRKYAALEVSLRRQDRLAAMGELASGVAHEVRNPLNAIGVIVQRLEREFEPTEDREEYLGLARTVRDEVRRINRIIQQFLTFARPPELILRKTDLAPVLEAAVEVVASQAASRGLRLERAFAPVGAVRIDPEQMKQVLLNLLSNAIEATEAGGEVRVSCRSVDALWAEVVVQDTGRGIPPEQQERIFDLYFRHPSQKGKSS